MSNSPKRSWPDSTFAWESEDQQHYCGSHWDPFYDSPDEILSALPRLIPESMPHIGFGDTYAGPHAVPESWCKGTYLYWPDYRWGLIAALRASNGRIDLANVSPYAERGVQVSIAVERVHVWSSGAEAQIEGLWGEALVEFFDLNFLSSRSWYESGRRLDFILNGIAYEASLASEEDLVVGHDSVLGGWLQGEHESGPARESRISLEGSSIFVHVNDWDRDDYWFRGPVRRVKAFSDWLGQSGWSVSVCVIQMDDEDAELEVQITSRAWSGPEPPQVGDDIKGTLWLQGRLWYLA